MQYFLLLLCCLFAVFICVRSIRTRRALIATKLHKKKKELEGDINTMLKIVETLIGKSCAIHTIDNDYEGTVLEINDGCIVLKDRWVGTLVFVNPEYVVGIRENKEKKSRKKAVVEEAAVTE